ncbi:MAG: ATP-binding protein [Gammaproteobacteria bacterium]
MLNRFKQWLLFQPLKRKILWVIMVVVIVTVASVSGFLYWHNDQQHREDFIRNNLLLVKLVGEYTTLPLVFDDKTGTNEQLSKLLQDPRVVYVLLKNADGLVMTDYDPLNLAAKVPLLDPKQEEYRWQDDYLYLAVAINRNNQPLGLLTAAFRLDEYKRLHQSELIFIIAAVLIAVICSLLMSLLLRKFVMSSIQQLEIHARRIAEKPGVDEIFAYPKRRNDEISQLYAAFNLLMQQVRNREAEILRLNANLESKVRQRTEALSAALKIKSAFLANMSHEIRTPMNAILGMLHLVLQTDLSPKQQDYITKANEAAKWLLGIINDILDYSKLESGKINLELSTFRLESVVKYLEDVAVPLLQNKPVILHFSVDSDIPALMGDQLRLGQILLNLISNAIKFTESGSITVLIKQLQSTFEQVKLEFSVIDTGIGINDEQRLSLFDPFTQADESTTRQYGGTGLGLTISKELVEAMGGKIRVESQLGFGSRFSFTVELGRASPMTLTQETPSASLASSRWKALEGAHLLLVEDNLVNQQIVLEVMGKYGITVDLASNGADAVTMVKTNNYAAILMDCLMPVMDGFIATQTIRANPQFANLPIIAMTANVMDEQRERCLASGMNDHIGKPIHWDELFEKLEHWIGGNTLPHQAAALPPDNTVDFPALPGVDHKIARQCVSGEVNLYWKLIRTIHQKHGDGVQLIERSFESGDIRSAAIQAHTLSGALSTIGALELSSLMSHLQSQLDKGQNGVVIKTLIERAKIEYNKLIDEIGRICRQTDSLANFSDGPINKPSMALSRSGEVLSQLEQIALSFKAHEAISQSRFEEIHTIIQREFSQAQANRLAQQIEQYDYASAVTEIRNLILELKERHADQNY